MPHILCSFCPASCLLADVHRAPEGVVMASDGIAHPPQLSPSNGCFNTGGLGPQEDVCMENVVLPADAKDALEAFYVKGLKISNMASQDCSGF